MPTFPVAASGAVRLNRNGLTLVEEQNIGADWVRRGLYHRRQDWCDQGWRILDWALDQQEAEGGWACRDPFHSAMRYLQALTLALLLDPQRITRQRMRCCGRALNWMTSRPVERRGLRHDARYGHRQWMAACLYQCAAVLFGRPRFHARAAKHALLAMSSQRPDGVYPELGGYDVAYQIYGSSFAQRFLMLCEDAAMVDLAEGSLRRALEWYVARMDPRSGIVSTLGSSRVSMEMGHGGHGKRVSYPRAVEVFTIAALMEGGEGFEAAALASMAAAKAKGQAA
ncbi:hypothetical protein [Roseomonas indoligenes]|nr:hypothetical protein [Pararoseomonas indoligenes]